MCANTVSILSGVLAVFCFIGGNMKPFKNLDEQIDILKSRNLKFKDEDSAKEYLLHYNYYNIINCYSKFFLETNDKYFDGVYFEDIKEVHHFDKEIKTAILEAIIEAERHIKSILAYTYSDIHKNKVYPYLNVETYEKSKLLESSNLIGRFSKIISDNKKTKYSNSIKHYANNHTCVPFWILIDYLTFGEINNFIHCSDDKVQNSIAVNLLPFLRDNLNTCNHIIIKPKSVILALENLSKIRNITAHNNVLLGHIGRNDLMYLKELHDLYGIKKADNRQDVYNSLLYLQIFITSNQFAILNNKLKKRTETLKKRISPIYFNRIINSLGFPSNWKVLNQNKK